MTAVQPWTTIPGARYRATENAGEIEVQKDERSSIEQLGSIGAPIIGASAGMGIASKLGGGAVAKLAGGALGLGAGIVGGTILGKPEFGPSTTAHVTPEQLAELEQHEQSANSGVRTGTTLAGASLAAASVLPAAKTMPSRLAGVGAVLGAYAVGAAGGYGLGALVD